MEWTHVTQDTHQLEVFVNKFSVQNSGRLGYDAGSVVSTVRGKARSSSLGVKRSDTWRRMY